MAPISPVRSEQGRGEAYLGVYGRLHGMSTLALLWRTCTGRGRTRTASPAWSRSSRPRPSPRRSGGRVRRRPPEPRLRARLDVVAAFLAAGRSRRLRRAQRLHGPRDLGARGRRGPRPRDPVRAPPHRRDRALVPRSVRGATGARLARPHGARRPGRCGMPLAASPNPARPRSRAVSRRSPRRSPRSRRWRRGRAPGTAAGEPSARSSAEDRGGGSAPRGRAPALGQARLARRHEQRVDVGVEADLSRSAASARSLCRLCGMRSRSRPLCAGLPAARAPRGPRRACALATQSAIAAGIRAAASVGVARAPRSPRAPRPWRATVARRPRRLGSGRSGTAG